MRLSLKKSVGNISNIHFKGNNIKRAFDLQESKVSVKNIRSTGPDTYKEFVYMIHNASLDISQATFKGTTILNTDEKNPNPLIYGLLSAKSLNMENILFDGVKPSLDSKPTNIIDVDADVTLKDLSIKNCNFSRPLNSYRLDKWKYHNGQCQYPW